jgi:hypothetical protein
VGPRGAASGWSQLRLSGVSVFRMGMEMGGRGRRGAGGRVNVMGLFPPVLLLPWLGALAVSSVLIPRRRRRREDLGWGRKWEIIDG